MKKYIPILIILLLTVIIFPSCNKEKLSDNPQDSVTVNDIDTTKPVFETKNIRRITFYSLPNHADGIEVPSEYMEEIITWIGTFKIDKKADDLLPPGTNTRSFRIEYSDGTVIKNGVNTITIDGVIYYLQHDKAPESYEMLFTDSNLTEPENELHSVLTDMSISNAERVSIIEKMADDEINRANKYKQLIKEEYKERENEAIGYENFSFDSAYQTLDEYCEYLENEFNNNIEFFNNFAVVKFQGGTYGSIWKTEKEYECAKAYADKMQALYEYLN